MKASILIISLALLIASISIGGSVKSLGIALDSSKIASVGLDSLTPTASPSKISSNFSHLYGNAIISEIGDMGGEEMVPRQTFGDMGGEEMVPRQTFGNVSAGKDSLLIYPNSDVISELAPSTIVYFGETTIPLSSYQNTLGKYLWIEIYGGLSQYASVPQYSSLYLMAYTSTGGPGEFLEMYPSASSQGIYQKMSFNFNPGYNRIPYRSDVAGRHHLLFSMKDQSSNAVIIDVGNAMGTSSPIVLGTAPRTGMQY